MVSWSVVKAIVAKQSNSCSHITVQDVTNNIPLATNLLQYYPGTQPHLDDTQGAD